MKIVSYLIFFISCSITSLAQQLPIGKWRTHLPYQNIQVLTASTNEIFAGGNSGILSYSLISGELHKITTIDGLSSVNISQLAYHQQSKTLVVVHQNTKIDLINNGVLKTYNDIFDKVGLNNKRVNHVVFKDQFAYLSCGFGIVVFDLIKKEVKDTYYLGDSGNLDVFQIQFLGSKIIALTSNGVYEANSEDPLLTDFRRWIKHGVSQNLPNGIIKSITTYNNFLYALIDDKIYKYDGSVWALTQLFGIDVFKLKTSNNQLLAISDFRIISYNSSEQIVKNTQNPAFYDNANDALIGADNQLYIGDQFKGFIRVSNTLKFEYLSPNGPNTSSAKDLNFVKGQLLLSPGGYASNYAPLYNNEGFSIYKDYKWESYSAQNLSSFANVRDIITSTIDSEEQLIYLASYFNGLIAFGQDQSIKIYNQANSTLQTTIGDPASIRVNGLAIDDERNVWVTQYGVAKPLSMKNKLGQWMAYSFSDLINNPAAPVTGLVLDFSNQKWLSVRNEGLIVFDGSKSRKFIHNNNNGLPGTNINCMKLDVDGALWIGTNQGIAVIESTDDAFGMASITIPKLQENGFLRPLLATENIKAIAVDGANRKWIGTDNGLWLFDKEGSKQILFFNSRNSPLPSEQITSLAIDDRTGELFIGTTSGLMSYQSDAPNASAKMEKIIVFPNPVRPGYDGLIGLRGLAENTTIKITDIAGNLVYESISTGGGATWDGKNVYGNKVTSGVYLILAVNKDGSETAITKLLVVR